MEDQPKIDEAWLATVNPVLRPVAEKHGRELFEFVAAAGMAGIAARQLLAATDKQRSVGMKKTVVMLCTQFDYMANTLGKEKGWTNGKVEEVNADVRAAQAGELSVVAKPPLILLQ